MGPEARVQLRWADEVGAESVVAVLVFAGAGGIMVSLEIQLNYHRSQVPFSFGVACESN